MTDEEERIRSIVRDIRNDALEEAAQKLEKHAADIVKAGDQFDVGGDIYSFHKPTLQAAAIVRSLIIV